MLTSSPPSFYLFHPTQTAVLASPATSTLVHSMTVLPPSSYLSCFQHLSYWWAGSSRVSRKYLLHLTLGPHSWFPPQTAPAQSSAVPLLTTGGHLSSLDCVWVHFLEHLIQLSGQRLLLEVRSCSTLQLKGNALNLTAAYVQPDPWLLLIPISLCFLSLWPLASLLVLEYSTHILIQRHFLLLFLGCSLMPWFGNAVPPVSYQEWELNLLCLQLGSLEGI